MMTEPHHILVASAHAQILSLQLQPGLIHRGTGHFAMQRVRIFRRRAAISQYTRVESKAAVSRYHFRSRFRLTEHVAHGQFMPVKLSIPDHLPHPGQNNQMSTTVFYLQPFHSAGVTKRGNREIAIFQ